MPKVDTKHPQYISHEIRWKLIRDVVEGESKVKAASTRYLPKISSQQTTSEYDAYRSRALFYDATSKTFEGLTGMIFRKPPKTEIPEGFEDLLMNVSLNGTPFVPFAKEFVGQVIELGRAGILVDAPPSQEIGDPYVVQYKAEDIINWRNTTHPITGASVLSLVVLREPKTVPDPEDPFMTITIDFFRVLRLGTEEGNLNPFYIQELWRRVEGVKGQEDGFLLIQALTPVRMGERLGFIPFVFVGSKNLETTVDKSPLLGLAQVNISHYRTMADLEHGAHFTALPTPVIVGDITSGEDEEPTDFVIGSGTAWWLRGEGANAFILEYTGQGLGALENRAKQKEKMMAVLGAKILEEQTPAVEAAATVALRHKGESSLLANISDTCSRGISKAISWAVWWKGHEDLNSTTVTFTKDFFETKMAADDVVKLTAAWQQGALGGEMLFTNLREGERTPPEWEFEDYQQDIEENGAMMRMSDFEDPEDEDDAS